MLLVSGRGLHCYRCGWRSPNYRPAPWLLHPWKIQVNSEEWLSQSCSNYKQRNNNKNSFLKGQCHEIYDVRFFLWTSFPQAPEYPLRAVSFFAKIRRDICSSRCMGFSWLGATCWRFCRKTQKEPAKCFYSVLYTVYSVLLSPLWLKSVLGWPAILSVYDNSLVLGK